MGEASFLLTGGEQLFGKIEGERNGQGGEKCLIVSEVVSKKKVDQIRNIP